MQDECLAGITDAIQSTHRPLPSRSVSVVVKASSSSVDAAALSRRAVVGTGLAFAAAVAAPMSLPSASQAGQVVSPDWEIVRARDPASSARFRVLLLLLTSACPAMQVTLPLDKGVVLLDVAFTDNDPNHGQYTTTAASTGGLPYHPPTQPRPHACDPSQASFWAHAKRCSRPLTGARHGSSATSRQRRTRSGADTKCMSFVPPSTALLH